MPVIQEFGKEEWPSRAFDKDLTKRPPATPELREKMDRELVSLGRLMKDSGAWWQLDGGLNISVRKGDYIGSHVDVDISVLRADMPRLEEFLVSRGYGLFLRNLEKEFGKRVFRRVGADAFRRDEVGEWQFRIMAINESGEIQTNVDLPSIEVAVIERDKEGRPLGWRGTVFPEKWLKGEEVEFHGANLILSHPARFLFNKIWFTRGYDDEDLKLFAETGALTLDDVNEAQGLAEPILIDFERDAEIGKKHADLIRERFSMIRRWEKEYASLENPD